MNNIAHTLRELEGCRVSVALSDGTRIDDAHLLSAPRDSQSRRVWIYDNGSDCFISLDDIRDAWEAPSHHLLRRLGGSAA